MQVLKKSVLFNSFESFTRGFLQVLKKAELRSRHSHSQTCIFYGDFATNVCTELLQSIASKAA